MSCNQLPNPKYRTLAIPFPCPARGSVHALHGQPLVDCWREASGTGTAQARLAAVRTPSVDDESMRFPTPLGRKPAQSESEGVRVGRLEAHALVHGRHLVPQQEHALPERVARCAEHDEHAGQSESATVQTAPLR